VGGLELYAWQDSRGGVYYTVLDNISESIVVPEQVLNSAYSQPKVIACGIYIFILAIKSGTSLVSVRYNPNTGLSSETVIALGCNGIFDVMVLGSNMVFVYGNASNFLAIGYLTQSNAVGNVSNGLPAIVTTTDTVTNCLALCTEPSMPTFPHIYVAYANSGPHLYSAAFNTDLTVYLAQTTITSINVTQVTMYTDGIFVYFIYQTPSSLNIECSVRYCALTIATNTAGSPSFVAMSVGLMSKVCIITNTVNGNVQSTPYVAVSYDTNAQATNFFLRIPDGFIVSKFSYSLGAGLLSQNNSLCKITVINNLAQFPSSKRVKVIAGTTLSFILGVYKHSLDFNPDRDIESSQLGGNLHINGGLVVAYDGFTAPELGFCLNPEIPTLALGSSGNLTGTYLYVVMWEWIDQAGQTHRSAPSQIATISGVSSQQVIVTIPTLRLTFKQPAWDRTNILAVVYRTVASGVIFYRVTGLSSPTYNDPTVNDVTFTDNSADSSITSNEILYTTGGIMPNTPPPAATLSHVFQNRLWLAGTEGDVVYYSKEFLDGDGVAFTLTNQLLINETAVPNTAISDLDNYFVIFKEYSTYVVSGPGPDDTGGNGSFSLPQVISGEIGCVNPRSIAKTPEGVMFLSGKGIYLLTRALGFEYIGAPVENFNNYTFTGTTIVSDLNQARFTTLQGTTLVYDWYFRKWYTFTNQQADSSKIWQNQFTILNTNGVVRVEKEGIYSDNLAVINTSIQTGWFSFANIQGFQRVYSIIFLGQFVGNHILQVSSFYNFQNSPFEIVQITPQNVIIGDIYGNNGVYGTNAVYGGLINGANVYQFEYKPAQQKCESIQLLIQDVFLNNTASGGFILTAMTFTVGLKNGQYKTIAAQRMT
jgi:hypothetical protein